MKQKRGLTDTISCMTMESPGCQSTSMKIWSKRKTAVEQEAPSRSRGHHRV